MFVCMLICVHNNSRSNEHISCNCLCEQHLIKETSDELLGKTGLNSWGKTKKIERHKSQCKNPNFQRSQLQCIFNAFDVLVGNLLQKISRSSVKYFFIISAGKK